MKILFIIQQNLVKDDEILTNQENFLKGSLVNA